MDKARDHLDRAIAWLTDVEHDRESDRNRMGAVRAEIKHAMELLDATTEPSRGTRWKPACDHDWRDRRSFSDPHALDTCCRCGAVRGEDEPVAQQPPRADSELLAGRRTRDNPPPRLTASVGADHIQHASERDAGNVAESERSPVGHRAAHLPATAQQPEAPTLVDDLVRRLRAWDRDSIADPLSQEMFDLKEDAAARIESDARTAFARDRLVADLQNEVARAVGAERRVSELHAIAQCEIDGHLRELAVSRERERALRHWLDNNTTFFDVQHPVNEDAPNVPVLASVSKRIWYHATDDQRSYPFSALATSDSAASPTGGEG